MSKCQLNNDSCLRGSVAFHQLDGSEVVGELTNGMLLMEGIFEVVDSKGATVSEIDETLPIATEMFPEIADIGIANNSDVDVAVLETEGMKVAWATRMPRLRFLTTILRESVSQLRKE